MKIFCTTKEMVSKLKTPPTELEKIFASHTSDKRLTTRIYRELKKLNSPQITVTLIPFCVMVLLKSHFWFCLNAQNDIKHIDYVPNSKRYII
jgi:hypothetical protein